MEPSRVRGLLRPAAFIIVLVAVAGVLANVTFGVPSDGTGAPPALIGLDSASIGSTPALIDSFDSALGPYSATNRGQAAILVSNGAVALDGAKVNGDVRSAAGGVTLKKQAVVSGNVTAGTSIANAGAIHGTSTPNSATPILTAASVAACAPFSAGAGATGTFTYANGDLTVTGNSTATLAAGAYCFRNLTISGGARLTVSGPVTITLTGRFKAIGNSVVNPSSIPGNLRISSSVRSADAGGNKNDETAGVLLGGTAQAYLSVYAPNADVRVSGDAQLFGSVLGKTLTTAGSAAMHFDISLATPPPPPPPPQNAAPVVSAGAPQTVTLPATVTLTGSVTDDGLPWPVVTAAWTQISGPVGALVPNPAQATTTATFMEPGTYALRLAASDGELSSSATTEVTVLDGGPSLAALTDRTIPLGTTFSMRLAASDPNVRDVLAYFLDGGPNGASLNPAPVIVWTPTAAQLGPNAFAVRVVDAAGNSDSKTFQITVASANHPPQIGAQPNQGVAAGGSFTRALSATDPDAGDTLTFSLGSGPFGVTLSGNQLSWNPVSAPPGEYFVTVAVQDSAGAIDAARFRLTVTAAAAPAARGDAYSVGLGGTLTVPAPGVLANDVNPDGGGLTAVPMTVPDKGTLSALNADGSFQYTAPPLLSGPALDVRHAQNFSHRGGNETGISPPLVVDVTGDGIPEIVSFHLNADLFVSRGDTGALVFHVSQLPAGQTSALIGHADCSLYGMGIGRYAAADIDDDGEVEIVLPAQCRGDVIGGLYGANLNERAVAIVYDPAQPEGYRVKWITPILSATPGALMTALNSFTIARLGPSEKPSVLFGKSFKGGGGCSNVRATFTDFACRIVFALNGQDGSVNRIYYAEAVPAGGFEQDQLGYMAPVVADVDDDGQLDVLYQGTLWDASGAIKHQFDATGAADASPGTLRSAVVDLDGDAQMEIVTLDVAWASGTGSLKAWKPDGRLLWWVPVPRVPGHILGELGVADVDRDGRPDIFFGLGNGIWVVDHAGVIKWSRGLNTPADGGGFQFQRAAFTVYDLNGDGVPEMVVQYGRNTIRFLRGDTGEDQVSWTYPGTSFDNGYGPHQPVVADVDGSGQAAVVWYREITFNGGGFVQVLKGDTIPWRPAPGHFNQAAYWGSNFNADGSVPTTYPRHTTTPATNVLGQQPPAPYAPNFLPASQTAFAYVAVNAAGVMSAPATVLISLEPQNRPPAFTTKAPTFFVCGPIDYFAHAVDPDLGDTVTYGMAWAPYGGGIVNAATGQLHIDYACGDPKSFIIYAVDSRGGIAYQSVHLRQAAGRAVVPNLVGMTQSAATDALTSALLATGTVTHQYDAAAAGMVIGQSPGAGNSLPQGESVDFILSRGPSPVTVPNAVGKPRTVAVTALSVAGFTVTTTTVFSNVIPAGLVIDQSPAAGALLSPGAATPVTLTVSGGTGLALRLDRSAATADQVITVTPLASDVDGNPTATPALTYTIAPKQTPFMGALPAMSGTTIESGPTTLGGFTITATDAVNGRSASADFAVLPPRVPGEKTNGESFVHMVEVLDGIHALKAPLKAARAANDGPQMTALLQQIVTLWRTVDLDDLRLSVAVVPPDGFPPTVEMMAGLGFRPTADDLMSHRVLKDAVADITAWTSGLKASGTPLSQLDALADQFSTRAARMQGLTVSSYGGINNSVQYTRLLAHAIPAFYEALSEELAKLTGLPPRTPTFPFASGGGGGGSVDESSAFMAAALGLGGSAGEWPTDMDVPVSGPNAGLAESPVMGSSLAEVAITLAVDHVVEKVMGEAENLFKSARQLAIDTMLQAAWTAGSVMLNAALKTILLAHDIPEVVAGASLSFREFQSAPSWIEAHGDDDPEVNTVLLIGPDLFTSVTNAGLDIVKKLTEGYSQYLDPKTNPNRYKNLDQVTNDLKGFSGIVKDVIQTATDVVEQQAKAVFQKPDSVLFGCAFDSRPECRQLIYSNGFQPVWTYSPPAGMETFNGLPVPVIVIVFNQRTSDIYFGTPVFMPCKIITDGDTKKVQCPNNAPFTP